jgi:uncharacterized membrane protein
MKKLVWTGLLVLAAISASAFAADKSFTPPVYSYEKGVVVKVTEGTGTTFGSKTVQVSIKSGKYKGKTVSTQHMESSGMMGAKMTLKPGDRIILYVEENPTLAESPDGAPMFNIADYERSNILYLLAGIFAALLVLIGGRQGFKALISLAITMGLIFFVVIPLSVKGFDPMLVAVAASAAVTLIVFRLVSGKTRKSVGAASGTIIGIVIAGTIAAVVGNIINLTGMSSEESKMLFYSMELPLNFKGLLFAGILIGALGAVMDVAMSIASSISEVHRVHPEADFGRLFKSGMNVGRDIMGTMSNTLILAYTGASLPLLILLSYGNMPFLKALNLELISEEILRALAGSIGLILSIPATAAVMAFLLGSKKRTPR